VLIAMVNGNETATETSFAPFCIYVIVLIIVLFIIFILYLYFFRKQGLREGKKHRCNYCGELVEVISDCCNSPVVERFLIGTCQKCKKECKIICSRCRKHIAG
jgi:hypothetical protein